MSQTASALGRCPDCGASIPAGRLLIAYERADGTAVYADCPGCRDVVHPA